MSENFDKFEKEHSVPMPEAKELWVQLMKTLIASNWQIKAFKEHRELSQETMAYSCNIYFGNKKVGEASNHGYGGPDDVHITSEYAERWKGFVSSLGKDIMLSDEYHKSCMSFGDVDEERIISIMEQAQFQNKKNISQGFTWEEIFDFATKSKAA